MAGSAERLYDQYFRLRSFERIDLFALLVERFGVRRALYPGSFVHVSPSFVIPSVTYVDSDRRCPAFFSDPWLPRMLGRRKRYDGDPVVVFHAQDYTQPLPEPDASFDLLISQYAGPVSQACKRYLRVGGILVVNNSHGDATLASLDRNYELVGVITLRSGKHRLIEENLAAYLVPKRGGTVDRDAVMRSGRGIAYVKPAAAYVFRRSR